MRTLAQQAASRANGARSRGPKTGNNQPVSSMDARALHLLTKATVLKSESRRGFHQLVHDYMLFFAPRNPVEQDAVEEICSATWRLYRLRAVERKTIDPELATQSFPDDLECLTHACGALPGAPSPAFRPCASPAKKRFAQTTPPEHTSGQPPSGPAGGAHCAPEPYFIRLRPHIPVPRTSARDLQKPPPAASHGEPKKNPPATCQNPRKTHRRGPLPLHSGSLPRPSPALPSALSPPLPS